MSASIRGWRTRTSAPAQGEASSLTQQLCRAPLTEYLQASLPSNYVTYVGVPSQVPTPAALNAMFQEMKDTLEHQVQTVDGLDDKAAQVFKFDALIVGLVTSGVSILLSNLRFGAAIPTWLVVVFGIGFTAIIVSALVAVWAYQVTRVRVGLRAEEVVEAIDDPNLDQPTLYEESVLAYGDGVVHNAQNIEATAFRLQIATWALWLGILLLAVATMGLLGIG